MKKETRSISANPRKGVNMKYRLTDEQMEWCGHILHRIEAEKTLRT